MVHDIRQVATEAIQVQARAVEGLQPYINNDFEKAVQLVHGCTGRLVVSGIGKSAIVGQKIVATLNSTGTPALFMHAADAIHGDLGMIQPEDVVLLISKSGESPEIKVLLPLIRNFGNKVLVMSSNPHSYLAMQADLLLNTSIDREVCPNNLAPTTSTTVQMVMGDALAVCLMALNGFTGNDFARLHPGGNLGKRLYLRVEDLYKQNAAPRVEETTGFKETIVTISSGRLGATALVDAQNKVLAIITDGNVRRLLEKTEDLKVLTAKDFASYHPKTITPAALAVEALEKLRVHDISQLLVVDDHNTYLGILHLHDLVREGIV